MILLKKSCLHFLITPEHTSNPMSKFLAKDNLFKLKNILVNINTVIIFVA